MYGISGQGTGVRGTGMRKQVLFGHVAKQLHVSCGPGSIAPH